MMEWGNTSKGREMTGKIGGEGSIEKKSLIHCWFDTSCKQLQIWLINAPRTNPFMWLLDSAWITLSNEGSPFPGSGIVK